MPWSSNGCSVSDLLAKRTFCFLNSHGDGLISIATGFCLLPFTLTGRNTHSENARLFWVLFSFWMLYTFWTVWKHRHLDYIFVPTFRTDGDIIFHLLFRFGVMWTWSFLFCFLSSLTPIVSWTTCNAGWWLLKKTLGRKGALIISTNSNIQSAWHICLERERLVQSLP